MFRILVIRRNVSQIHAKLEKNADPLHKVETFAHFKCIIEVGSDFYVHGTYVLKNV